MQEITGFEGWFTLNPFFGFFHTCSSSQYSFVPLLHRRLWLFSHFLWFYCRIDLVESICVISTCCSLILIIIFCSFFFKALHHLLNVIVVEFLRWSQFGRLFWLSLHHHFWIQCISTFTQIQTTVWWHVHFILLINKFPFFC